MTTTAMNVKILNETATTNVKSTTNHVETEINNQERPERN